MRYAYNHHAAVRSAVYNSITINARHSVLSGARGYRRTQSFSPFHFSNRAFLRLGAYRFLFRFPPGGVVVVVRTHEPVVVVYPPILVHTSTDAHLSLFICTMFIDGHTCINMRIRVLTHNRVRRCNGS